MSGMTGGTRGTGSANGNGRVQHDPSIGQLIAGVTGNVSSLVRLELELAKSELSAQAKQGAVGGAFAAVAAFLALLALIMASIAAALGLAHVMPAWAAFLVVAGAYLLVAAVLVLLGVRKFKRLKGPQRAQTALNETKDVLAQRSRLRGEAKDAGLSVHELQLHESDARAHIAATDAARSAARLPE